MKLRLGVVLALLVPVVACRAPEKPKPPPNPPSITSFTVDQQAIRRGQMVTFNFTVERGQSVELVGQSGSAIAMTYDDLAGVGSAKASPERSAFYVLRAEGEGGRDSAFVQVAVDEGLQSVFLVVVPQQIKPGQRVDLIWSAAGGRNVRLAAGARMLSMLESGSTNDSPMTTTTYTLSGERADGSLSSQSATVTVVPVVESFTATPPAAKPGETITLAWKTAGADQIVVEEATFGQLVSTSMNVAMGTVDFVVPTAGGRLLLCEAKTSSTVLPADAKNMQRLRKAIGDRVGKCILVHRPGRTAPRTTVLAPGVEAHDVDGLLRSYERAMV